jgi:ABC-type uncharacterized transport system, auxiliary component
MNAMLTTFSCAAPHRWRSAFSVRAALAPLLCAVLLLSSCVSGMLNPGPPPTRLALSPALPGALPGLPVDKQLVVAVPVSGSELDTDRIVLVFSGREVRSLAQARWTGSAPTLFRAKMIEALESTGSLRGIGDEMAGLSADARLLTDLRKFALYYENEGGTPVAVIEAGFRLLNLRDGRIAGALTVAGRAAAAGNGEAELARAMEEAMKKVLDELAPWVVGEMRKLK